MDGKGNVFRETENPVLLSRTDAFLAELTGRNTVISGLKGSLPEFSEYSFLCLIGKETEKDAERIRSLWTLCPGSFYRFFDKGKLLIVLYDRTGNFPQLERMGKRFVEKGFCAGIFHHGIGGLVSSFLEACEVVWADRLSGSCRSFEEISSSTGQILKDEKIVELERSIRTDLQFREGRNVLRYIHQWFQESENLHHTLDDMRFDSINLYGSIKYTLFDMYDLKLKRIKAGREVHEILNIQSREELEDWFCTWFLYTLDNFDLMHANSGFQLKKVLAFIDSHILDDLSLNTIASYFYVNASYFSVLFKKETGQTYISYITAVKMEKAIELLQSGMKVYEVAEMLGYEDVRHFRNVFKRHFGCVPSCMDRV